MSQFTSEAVSRFKIVLDGLKEHPDKLIIDELTNITIKRENLPYGKNFTDLIINKLATTPVPSFRLPMFYLIDSIMKKTGGPYYELFGKALFESYTSALPDVPVSDRPKFEKLFDTWVERKFFSVNLINILKSHIKYLPLVINS